MTGVISRLGARVLARRRPPARAGGLRLAQAAAERHRPGGLAAAARLSRERVAVARGRRTQPQQELPVPPGMSEFAARWIFGDGAVEGTPFAAGAALESRSLGPPSFLARRPAEGPEPQTPPPVRPPSGPVPRGRVEEVPAFRLSPAPAAPADEPERPAAPADEAPPEQDAEAATEAAAPSVPEPPAAAPAPAPAPAAERTAASTRPRPRPALLRAAGTRSPARAAVPVRPVLRPHARAEAAAATPALPQPGPPTPARAPGRLQRLLRRAAGAARRPAEAAPSPGREDAGEAAAAAPARPRSDAAGPSRGSRSPGPPPLVSPTVPETPRAAPGREGAAAIADGAPRPSAGRLLPRLLRRVASPRPQPAPAPAAAPAAERDRPLAEPAPRRPLARRLLRRATSSPPASPARSAPPRAEAAGPADAASPGEPPAAPEHAHAGEPSAPPAGRPAAGEAPAESAVAAPPGRSAFELADAGAPLPRILRRHRHLHVAVPPGGEPGAEPDGPAPRARRRVPGHREAEPGSRPTVRIARTRTEPARGSVTPSRWTSAERLAAATGGTVAREALETASVLFPRPAGAAAAPSEPGPTSSAPLLAVARQAAEAPAADAAPEPPSAPAPAPAPGGSPDLDELYEQVLGRLRRDLVAERERIGDLIGELT